MYFTADGKPPTTMGVCFTFVTVGGGVIVLTPSPSQASMGSHNRGKEVKHKAALCPTVSAMATLGNRSGSVQDGAIIPSDLLTS